MTFRSGQRIKVAGSSQDESWEPYMNRFVGLHGIITDPDVSKNDPDALIEVCLVGQGTMRLPQDSLAPLDDEESSQKPKFMDR